MTPYEIDENILPLLGVEELLNFFFFIVLSSSI
jgi:hypothetical protein